MQNRADKIADLAWQTVKYRYRAQAHLIGAVAVAGSGALVHTLGAVPTITGAVIGLLTMAALEAWRSHAAKRRCRDLLVH